MIRIFRLTNLCRKTFVSFSPIFGFSKASQNPSKNQNPNYVKSREPIIKLNESAHQSEIPDTVTNDKIIMTKLLLANLCFMSVLPFWATVNAGIVMLNAGFIMNQVGQQLKKFLIAINNNHYQQLKNYKSFPLYSKIIMRNMLFLASQASLLAFQQYQFAHLLIILWYAFCIYNKTIPLSYYPVVLSILFAILINLFKKPIIQHLQKNQKKQSILTKS